MERFLRTAAVIMAVLFLAAGTVSAQQKKQLEKNIKIVTIDDKGVKKDTTIISIDTLGSDTDAFFFKSDDGKIIRGTGKGKNMVVIERGEDTRGMMPGMMMRPMRGMGYGPEAEEGVNYHIAVDGVVVNIRAPKEKAGEADLILQEAKKILMKK
jgi:hypothetical protein